MKRLTAKDMRLSDEAIGLAIKSAMKEENKMRAGHWNSWGYEARVLIALANDRKNLEKRIKELEELIQAVA